MSEQIHPNKHMNIKTYLNQLLEGCVRAKSCGSKLDWHEHDESNKNDRL